MIAHRPSKCQNLRTPHVVLPEIHWVHRPDNLREEIDEAEDLCPECCERMVEEYRAKYPKDASEIIADGGWGSESDVLPTCAECGTELGCLLIEGCLQIERWGENARCINTLADWKRAMRRLK